jgi:hypothetical protein
LNAITSKLGIGIKDLFHHSLADTLQQRMAKQRRATEKAAQGAANQAKGRTNDLLRQAEYLIQSALGLNIEPWSHDELDKRLNALADAYQILERGHP